MLLNLGILRLRQIFRVVSGVGIFRFLFLVAIVTILLAGLIKAMLNPNYQIPAAIFWLIAIFTIHIRRGDFTFIQINFEYPFLVHFAEYTLLSLPLILPLIVSKQHLLWLVFLVTLFAISHVKPFKTQQNLNTKIQSMIPAMAYEWKAGARKYFYPIMIIWLAAVFFSFLEASVPLAIFVIGLMIFNFYQTGEPLDMLLVFEAKPARLIRMKLKLHFSVLFCLCLPLLVLHFLLHAAIWYIPIAILLLLSFSHLYLILLKYAFYAPVTKPAGIEILTSLALVAIIVPVFMPVIWLLSLHYYFKAVKTLKPYLNDFN